MYQIEFTSILPKAHCCRIGIIRRCSVAWHSERLTSAPLNPVNIACIDRMFYVRRRYNIQIIGFDSFRSTCSQPGNPSWHLLANSTLLTTDRLAINYFFHLKSFRLWRTIDRFRFVCACAVRSRNSRIYAHNGRIKLIQTCALFAMSTKDWQRPCEIISFI